MKMKMVKFAFSALATALVLAGCGGGGSDQASTNNTGFSSMVVFGDSLSDIGSYKVGVVAAVGGGRQRSRAGPDGIASSESDGQLPCKCWRCLQRQRAHHDHGWR